ncbi:MAG: hypothetical protein KKA81_17325 [Bacteroidetes bacterium]|nr:hypothetical protein [Bacteroidota bacterium]
MVDFASISGTLSGLKTAYDIVKSIKDMDGAVKINAAVIELQSVILDAQTKALDAQQVHAAQVDLIGDLEKEVARLKEQVSDREKYELKRVSPGAFAYMLKKEERGSEPPHWLCQNCYDDGKKSVLQALPNLGSGAKSREQTTYKCPKCSGTITASFPAKPKWIDGS